MSSRTASEVITVTGTGYSGQARQQVRRMAASVGVRYSGDLIYGVTTHLVAKSTAHALSDKTAAAHAWGIPVLLHDWLAESVQVGCILPAKKTHLVLPESLQFTASQQQQQSTMQQSRDNTFSAIVKADVEPEKLRSHTDATHQQLADLFLSPTTSNSPGDARPCAALPIFARSM